MLKAFIPVFVWDTVCEDSPAAEEGREGVLEEGEGVLDLAVVAEAHNTNLNAPRQIISK